ncbi:PucR family transcriptional regulator [Saliterribacillus persicus]|uniref:PucR-like helix-turn-helix protein n=1 Tax=Saliterribacillus persicus TaxID=930114 RepID=A0A368XNT3_9BACI|nr:helix-turn-helix domain-containing protein [Saliterribacillus persicus]RCW69650.1 PucR-like helix-turn-helix protein [Saliterribacillus persicus]
MIKELEALFPNFIEATTETMTKTEGYFWYLTPDGYIIGIPNDDLSTREQKLLETFLTPYYANQPPTNSREEVWMDILFHNKIPDDKIDPNTTSFHFVYFSLSDESIDPESFREAIYGLFPEKTSILWENNHEGVIIEERQLAEEDAVSYTEVIEVLVSDFYMNIHLFVGPVLRDVQEAHQYYAWIKKTFHRTIKQNHAVLHYIEAVPMLLLGDSSHEEKQAIARTILQDVAKDEELLKTIRVFLEANSNTTLAAKRMYMHRNSLQYRVDKFIEKTGIDVKQFSGALAVYLCLLLKG